MLFPDGYHTRKGNHMLSREDFFMIKQMRLQGAYIVDIATYIGCSERTVRRYLKFPEPTARKTRFKMAKLRPFMDYIDMRLTENVWNAEVILHEIKADGLYRRSFHAAVLHPTKTENAVG